jgi:hypothetical protein
LGSPLAFLAIAAIFLALAPSALAAETHVFDPVLSLTGGCTTSEVDPVADPSCPETKERPLVSPRSVTTDSWGDIYVASFGSEGAHGAEGRIDIFSPKGFFIAEIQDSRGPKNIAVDSKGNLYVFNYRVVAGEEDEEIVRYKPTTYSPAAEEIEYAGVTAVVVPKELDSLTGLAINPLNDHLFVNFATHITEYGSAEEGNEVVDATIGKGVLSTNNFYGVGLAVDAGHGLIYASDHSSAPEGGTIRAFELSSPHALVRTIDGSTTPAGKFSTIRLSVAVDESTGHLFVYDEEAKVVYEFTEDGEYVSTIEHSFKPPFGAEIGVDNGVNSPNGVLNPNGRYLFVPSGPSGIGHSFAFEPRPQECAPEVESVSFANVTSDEAELRATINPCNLETAYRFEYTSLEEFEEEGFGGAQTAGETTLPAGNLPVNVNGLATGLAPGSPYRFRVVAENNCEPGGCSDEAEGEFTTFPAPEAGPCSNDAFRTGPSALLPDCRTYELVTPPDTNARAPLGLTRSVGIFFPTRRSSPSGDEVSFMTEGGALPGFEGTGSLGGDPYLATRQADGWTTTSAGPTGAEAQALRPGGASPDQGYSFWGTASGSGSAAMEGKPTSYVRYPDGHSALIGRGSIGTDIDADGKLISEGGGHIVFVSPSGVQLEPDAPPNGTRAIYDRTADEVTHVVSLLPGNVTPATGKEAHYVGASLDGRGIAFTIENTLYLRYEDEETYEAGENVTFAGIAEGGGRIFYLKGGDLYAFDAKAEETIRFTESGDVTPVNVSPDGAAAYFVSPSVLTGEENPNGATAQAGKENLYRSEEGEISFVGTVTERDVEGEFGATEQTEGLGLWTAAIGPGSAELPARPSIDPSRTTPGGAVLLFESRAALTSYDPAGHDEVYRYDSVHNELDCLSCNPTGAPASGQANLQSISQERGGQQPLTAFVMLENLRPDGRRAFFQSTEQLVLGDTDGLQDVYEWEAQGVGTCERPGGCVFLISSGQSSRTDYLFAISDNGDDVFFRSSDRLLPTDDEETASVYDARVNSALLPKETCEGGCCGPDCRQQIGPPPFLPTPVSPPLGTSGNIQPKHCPEGTHKAWRHGKLVCVKHHHRHRHRKPGSKRSGTGK